MISIKIGRNTYEISDKDEFLDNKSCIQLITQSKEKLDYGTRPSPILTKRVIKEISAFKRVQLRHSYGTNCELFRLKNV
jgi:hypothetical protein